MEKYQASVLGFTRSRENILEKLNFGWEKHKGLKWIEKYAFLKFNMDIHSVSQFCQSFFDCTGFLDFMTCVSQDRSVKWT